MSRYIYPGCSGVPYYAGSPVFRVTLPEGNPLGSDDMYCTNSATNMDYTRSANKRDYAGSVNWDSTNSVRMSLHIYLKDVNVHGVEKKGALEA